MSGLSLRGGKAAGTRNALVVCPRFFQYPEMIAAELEREGYRVWLADDRPARGTLYKLLLRLFPALMGKRSTAEFTGLAETLAGTEMDLVLVIKGEAMTPPAVAALRRAFPKARFSYYLWDSVRNVGNAPDIAPLFDSIATFDAEEAARFGWRYRPLFSSAVARPDGPGAEKLYDWSFIGTIHSDRARVIRRLRRALPGRAGFVFGYFPSPLIALAHRLKDPAINADPPGTISLKPMPGERTRQILDQSTAIIDVEHPRQTGLTMRTVETLLAGRKLITTNRQVQQSALFHPSRVHVIDRAAPMVPDEFFDTPFEPLPAPTVTDYGLAAWVQDLARPDPADRQF
ncbi:MAG: hypothetical protein ABS76_26825 [Pelagibacterium sp. SCN 64-44]|nr:MAG: hypothetical protein ABS76_26825 [Pelagibacterium sp. SCN 64-44]